MEERQKGEGMLRGLMRWCRYIHRHLSFFFAGVIIIYALSGILMNHRAEINTNYSAKRIPIAKALPNTPLHKTSVSQVDLLALLDDIGEGGNYTKHYFPDDHTVKVFLKGGSTLEVDLTTGNGTYDQLRRRPLLSYFVRLHYNPGQWWTYFSDLFAIALIIITLSGLFLVRGKKGVKGIGGVELIAGILAPLLFLFI